ncbi:hypothetical protein [Kytococcus sp. Marseille-QA3725]
MQQNETPTRTMILVQLVCGVIVTLSGVLNLFTFEGWWLLLAGGCVVSGLALMATAWQQYRRLDRDG